VLDGLDADGQGLRDQPGGSQVENRFLASSPVARPSRTCARAIRFGEIEPEVAVRCGGLICAAGRSPAEVAQGAPAVVSNVSSNACPRACSPERGQTTVVSRHGEEDLMTTTDAATQPELKDQAGKLLGQLAGYVGHRTVEIGLRLGLVAELAQHPDGKRHSNSVETVTVRSAGGRVSRLEHAQVVLTGPGADGPAHPWTRRASSGLLGV
jgi:hypothetical protein